MRVDGADKDGMLELFNAGLDRLMNLRNSVDKPLFDLLLRRMENYVGDLSDPTDDQLSDIDVMHGELDGEIGGEINEAEFFRSLPVRRPADLEDCGHSISKSSSSTPTRLAPASSNGSSSIAATASPWQTAPPACWTR